MLQFHFSQSTVLTKQSKKQPTRPSKQDTDLILPSSCSNNADALVSNTKSGCIKLADGENKNTTVHNISHTAFCPTMVNKELDTKYK